MEEVELPIHEHPLLRVTRFSRDGRCGGCWDGYMYGGYRCNELGCEAVFHRECAESLPEINHSHHPNHPLKLEPSDRFSYNRCNGCHLLGYISGGYRCSELGCGSVFHRECAESLPEINHSLHPDHPLKLLLCDEISTCNRCRDPFEIGYICSICDFKLDIRCAQEPAPLLILQNSNLHQHPLQLFSSMHRSDCKTCGYAVLENDLRYGCHPCEFVIHPKCAKFFPEATHTSHPQHLLKLLTFAAIPDYADKKCLFCEKALDDSYIEKDNQLYHCDVCNFSICPGCVKYPPPFRVESPTTHEHELHLIPRRIDFTCNACGMLGDRSPYFCVQCNFMIHRQCIDLPRIININRHDHRISYTRRLGYGEERKCKLCRKKVDGFYGAYTCIKCPSFVVHSLCATKNDVWDMRELEEMSEEEEEIAPFEVIDDSTIKHFSHDHNLLQINKDGHDPIQLENIVCEACRLQILSELFYSCKPCQFFLHEKCANHPRKKRHFRSNLPFTLLTNSRNKIYECRLCDQLFTGFRYKTISDIIIDVRCAAMSDTLEHGSHPHFLYYNYAPKDCSQCGERKLHVFSCVERECAYTLDGKCAQFPKKVLRNRYDDHPLFLSFGGMNVDSAYWCEACEKKVDPKEWFYTCNDCGTILHISCVVGDFSYIMPGSHLKDTIFKLSDEEVVSNTSDDEVVSHNTSYEELDFITSDEKVVPNKTSNEEVVSNTFICRPLCSGRCNYRCKLPSILKASKAGVDVYYCSSRCHNPYLK